MSFNSCLFFLLPENYCPKVSFSRIFILLRKSHAVMSIIIPHTWRTADKEPKWPWARDCIYAGCQWYSVKWMRWDVSRDSAFKLCYSSGTCVCKGACLSVESCFIFFAETWQQERRSPAQGLFRWRISLRTQPLIKWKHCLVFLVKSRRCICSLSEFKLIIPTDVSIN